MTPSIAALAVALFVAASPSRADDPAGEYAAAALVLAAQAQRSSPAAARPAPPPRPAAKAVDLLAEFPGPSNRDQGDIGSCHAFGSTAVLEAAYDRKNGRHIAIAEEDVFLQRTVLTGDVYSQFCSDGACTLAEGNDPAEDIDYVLQHGALTARSYEQFAQRYIRYRKAEQETMAGIQQTYEQMSWLEKLLYDPRAHWKELSTAPQAKTQLTSYLEGRDSAQSAERARVRQDFAGFTRRTESDFGYSDANKALAPLDCLKRGAALRAALKRELDAKRPVCVSMNLAGLSAWGQRGTTTDAWHAFVIVGYRESKGRLAFVTRNSWGGKNPDVTDEQLCRIYALNTVLAPGEKPTF